MKVAQSMQPHARKGAGVRAGRVGYVSAFLGGELAMIPAIRTGVPAERIFKVAVDMRRPKEQIMKMLHISRATVGRKMKNGAERLSPEQSERVIGLERLIGQVQVMVDESGDPAGFDAAQWVANWIEEPVPALGGAKPADYLDTIAGQQLISRLLAQMQSGAFA